MRLIKSPQSILVKISAIIIALYILIISTSILISTIFFFSINSSKDLIEKLLYKYTNYNIQLNNINTKINNDFLPELSIKKLSITNPKDLSNQLQINNIKLVFSYASFWHLFPIFKEIVVDDTNLLLIKDKNRLLLNGFLLNSNINNKQEFDIERYLLRHSLIKISHLNFKFIDTTEQIPNIQINNIDFILSNRYFKKHTLNLTIPDIMPNNDNLNINLLWSNNKLSNFMHLQNAELNIKTLSNKQSNNANNNLVDKLNNKLNTLGHPVYQEFHTLVELLYSNFDDTQNNQTNNHKIQQTQKKSSQANFLINIKIHDGQISKFFAKINYTNLFIKIKQKFLINTLSANINVLPDPNNIKQLLIDSSNINLKLNNYNILQDYSIHGFIDKTNYAGQIYLDKLNLSNISHLYNIFSNNVAPQNLSYQLNGIINNPNILWHVKNHKLSSYDLNANIQNLSFINNDNNNNRNNKQVTQIASMPEIFGLNAQINYSHELVNNHADATILLNMQNGYFKDKKIFLIPYEFKNLNIKLNLDTQLDQNKQLIFLKLKIPSGIITTKDFSASLDGEYTLNKQNIQKHGLLQLNANLDTIMANKVANYLPIEISTSVHKWLNMAIQNGEANNAKLVFDGYLSDFPFSQNNGKFFIEAKLKDITLKYADDWQELNKINGIFKIRNHQIIIDADKLLANNNLVTSCHVIIPDMTSSKAYLIAQAQSFASTHNFLKYLEHTPLNKILDNLPTNVTATGNGKLKLQLIVPFDSVEHNTKVTGDYQFINNKLIFTNLPVPTISNLNGNLHFTQNSIDTQNTNFNALDSNLKLKITTNLTPTNTTNNINFHLHSDKLNYQQLNLFYLPSFNNLLIGNANTDIVFFIAPNTVGFKNLKLTTDVNDVHFLLPSPFMHDETMLSDSKHTKLELELYNNQNLFDVYFNYLDRNLNINSKIILDHSGKLLNANFDINDQLLNSNDINNNNINGNSKSNTSTNVTTTSSSLTTTIPKIKINLNTTSFNVLTWIDAIKKIFISNNTTANNTTANNTTANNIDSQQIKQKNITPNYTSLLKQELPSIKLNINTNTLILDNNNYSNAKLLIDTIAPNNNYNSINNVINFSLDATDVKGSGSYHLNDNILKLNIKQLHLNKSRTISQLTTSVVNDNNNNVNNPNSDNKKNFTYPPECNDILTIPNESQTIKLIIADNQAKACYLALHKLRKLFVHNQTTKDHTNSVANDDSSNNSNNNNIPNTFININNLLYDKFNLGKFMLDIQAKDNNVLFNNGSMINDLVELKFNGMTYCTQCSIPDNFTSLKTEFNFNNFGEFLNQIGIDNIIKKGKGSVVIRSQWNGNLDDFNIKDSIAHITMDLNSGEFLKTQNNSIINNVIGIITLQTLTQLIKLDFASLFNSGFIFEKLSINAYLINNILAIKELTMIGTQAIVKIYGNINLSNNQLNLYLSVTPHLDTSTAIATAIATVPTGIGPAVVGASYAVDWLLGKPFNKLFTFSYHVTGDLTAPILNVINIRKQITNNVGSTITDTLNR